MALGDLVERARWALVGRELVEQTRLAHDVPDLLLLLLVELRDALLERALDCSWIRCVSTSASMCSEALQHRVALRLGWPAIVSSALRSASSSSPSRAAP
jgi:hypothetical protein